MINLFETKHNTNETHSTEFREKALHHKTMWIQKYNKCNKLQKKVYQVENIGKSFDTILIHGRNVLLHPFSQNQIQFEKSSLFAPVYQPIPQNKVS